MKKRKDSVFYEELSRLADPCYRQFAARLTSNLPEGKIMGIRIPALRALAKRLGREASQNVAAFLKDLPHRYYDEDNLHALLICEQKDFHKTVALLNDFLPYVDNWATCDILSPKVFKKHKADLLRSIEDWMRSDHEYTVRFGIAMLMTHFLDAAFDPIYLERVAAVRHEAYYVKMMAAWYFATALAKQYERTVLFFEQNKLDLWTYNKAIQKAKESRRIPDERKEFLNGLKRTH